MNLTPERTKELERLVRKLRSTIFDYPECDQDKVTKLINHCKQRIFSHAVSANRNAYADVMWM